MTVPASATRPVVRVALGMAVALLAMAASAQSAPEAGSVTIPEQPTRTTGYAYTRDGEQLIYTEQHTFSYDDQGRLTTHAVDYVSAAGDVWAVKSLDYRKNAYAPDFKLEDQRSTYVEGGELLDDEYRLFRVRDDKPGDKTIDMNEATIVDAGFDTYVRANLDALREGKVGTIELAVPSSLIRLKFRIKPLGDEELFGLSATRFRVEPASLLRLIADAIDITYDRASGRLLRYEGLTNIRDAEGKRYDARIDFPPDEYRVERGDAGA